MIAFDEPTSEAQAVAAVQAALSAKTPLRLAGGGTRAALGRPVAAAKGLSSAKLSGITLYEPAEMVIGAKSGTPLAEIEAALAEKGQMLAFEPMDHRALLGSSGTPTIGAIAAGNFSGPRRIAAGGARDSLIGVRYVNGRGEAIKNGGRVMKNVTGLDLVKFQAGAFGTLGFLTEVIFRVVPRAPSAAVLVIEGLEDARAIDAMSTALTSPYEVTGAAHLPADVGGGRSSGGTALTLLRIEGFAESISYRTRALRHMLAGFGAATTLDAEEGAAAFADLRDGKPLAAQDAAVWRLSVKPGLGAQAVAAIRTQRSARAYYDWGGGLIWLATGLEGDAGASAIRAAAKAAEGYATLIRAPESLRVVVPVFEPETAALAALTKRVKAASDPEGIFNPGLMFAGI
jgi:glycolate oxidase FAD binding subunit